MPAIATTLMAIHLEIVQQLCQGMLMKYVELSPARTINPKPNSLLVHHPPQTRERQPVITKYLHVPRRHHVDGLWQLRQNFVCLLHWLGLVQGRKACQSFSPKMLAFESFNRRDFSPTVVNFEQFNSSAQRVS